MVLIDHPLRTECPPTVLEAEALLVQAFSEQETPGEAVELRQALVAPQRRVTELVQDVEVLLAREQELREQFVHAHDQLLRRDEEFRTGFLEVIAQRDALAAERDALTVQRDTLIAHLNAWQTRWAAIRDSLPGRIYRWIRMILTLGRR